MTRGTQPRPLRYRVAIALGVCLSAGAVVGGIRGTSRQQDIVWPEPNRALLGGYLTLSAEPMCNDLPVVGSTPAHPGPYEPVFTVKQLGRDPWTARHDAITPRTIWERSQRSDSLTFSGESRP